jgi:Fic family protein
MQVVKLRKGGEEFYYLKHSFRKDGKTITKEKYLGKTLPAEAIIGLEKKALLKEQKAELLKKLEKIKQSFQKEWKSLPETARENELKEIAIAFTYNTNAIEGSTITLDETREIIEEQISPNKPLRDIKETEAHARLFLEMLKKPEKITKWLILKWHNDIFHDTKRDIAGKFRDYLVRVGDYRAPDWQDVEQLMSELVSTISKGPKEMSTPEFAGLVHYRFEKIHPFGDGNGRIGRLLINQMLWHAGYPMVIIPYKKRKAYCKALKKDEEGFIKHFIRHYLSIHKKRLE